MSAQSPISANFPREDWQPTRATLGFHYVGDQVCAACHAPEASTQSRTGMGQALSAAAACDVLDAHPNLSVKLGRYTYRIATSNGSAVYAVSDSNRSVSVALLWALGRGNAGQTYIFSYHGAWYESQVSYFNQIQGLDLTLAHDPAPPQSLETALGKRLSHEDAVRCFACHATAAVNKSGLQLNRMTPGITCEGCHGAGAEHVAAVRAGRSGDLHIFNPARLSGSDLTDFCGSCHRTALDVAALNVSGVQTVRFQSYRLFLSLCFLMSKGSISCVTCHDPHKPLQHSEAFYDSKCLACHGRHEDSSRPAGKGAAHCPVSRKSCTACHMPKYALPGGHFKFADHDIRIVRDGEPFPG